MFAVEDRISAFQEDEFVKDALEKGMDLRQYARQVENEMQELQSEHENDCKLYIKRSDTTFI